MIKCIFEIGIFEMIKLLQTLLPLKHEKLIFVEDL